LAREIFKKVKPFLEMQGSEQLGFSGRHPHRRPLLRPKKAIPRIVLDFEGNALPGCASALMDDNALPLAKSGQNPFARQGFTGYKKRAAAPARRVSGPRG